jgi:hypothetical protein
MRSTLALSVVPDASTGDSDDVQESRTEQIIKIRGVQADVGDPFFLFIFCPSVVVQAFYPMSEPLPAAWLPKDGQLYIFEF